VTADLRREHYDGALALVGDGPSGPCLADDGLARLAEGVAALGTAGRIEALAGLLAAAEVIVAEIGACPASTQLVGIVLAVTQRMPAVGEAAEVDERARRLLDRQGSHQPLDSGTRPDGTVAAGPAARFAALTLLTKKPPS
jgi:hypothetical protein